MRRQSRMLLYIWVWMHACTTHTHTQHSIQSSIHVKLEVKLNFSLKHATKDRMGVSSTLSLTRALDGLGGQRHAPAALPPGNTRYSLYRRLGGPQDRSERVRKNSLQSTRVHKHTHINNAITNRILQQHMFTRYNSKYIRLNPTNAYSPSTGTLYFPLSVPDSGDRFRRHKKQ